MSTITPTVGRIVWYRPAGQLRHAQPHAAIVAHVHNDALVNLAVFDCEGFSASQVKVPLVQGENYPPATGHWCEWMPYQKGQAAKAETLEQRLAEISR